MIKKITLDYNTLIPYLSAKTLDIHYNILYNNYVTKLNNNLKDINYENNFTLPELVNNIATISLKDRGEILYNLGGTLNHGLYFYNISDKKNNIPVGKLKIALDKEFGGYEEFKKTFIKKCQDLVGSGYTFLVLDSNKKLRIVNMINQDTPYFYGFIPIMTIDLWEHAYFLDYTNKNEYIENFFNIVDYKKINNIYEKYI